MWVSIFAWLMLFLAIRGAIGIYRSPYIDWTLKAQSWILVNIPMIVGALLLLGLASGRLTL